MENFVNEFNMWMQTVQSELQEKSMRSTIIICAATLDAQLEKLIKNILLQEKNTDGDIFEGGNAILSTFSSKITLATVYKGNIIKNLIMDCQSYTKYRPNETTGGIFVSWRRKEELPTGA